MRSRSRSPSPPSSRHRHHHKSSREHREHRDHRDHGDRHSHHSHRHHSRRDRDRARSPSPSPIRDRRPLVDDFGRERNPKPPRESRHGSSPVRERSRGGGGSSSRRDDRYDRRPDRYKAADSLRARRRSRSRSRSPATNGHRRDRRAESVTSSSSTSSRKKAITGGAVPKSLLERPEITEADLEGKSAEEQEMLKLMGFGGFETTKGKKVTGNDVSAVNLLQKRKYRQYMNRKGGFNRPLDFVA